MNTPLKSILCAALSILTLLVAHSVSFAKESGDPIDSGTVLSVGENEKVEVVGPGIFLSSRAAAKILADKKRKEEECDARVKKEMTSAEIRACAEIKVENNTLRMLYETERKISDSCANMLGSCQETALDAVGNKYSLSSVVIVGTVALVVGAAASVLVVSNWDF